MNRLILIDPDRGEALNNFLIENKFICSQLPIPNYQFPIPQK